ncbi:MAG: hypothetical protein KC486_09375, partial [Myxococcales bacterium]|nr:hypothetical protein [Myxococcales bacterium]
MKGSMPSTGIQSQICSPPVSPAVSVSIVVLDSIVVLAVVAPALVSPPSMSTHAASDAVKANPSAPPSAFPVVTMPSVSALPSSVEANRRPPRRYSTARIAT